MTYYILKYKTVNNYTEKRKPFRTFHFEHIQNYVNNNEIVMGGAAGNPADEVFIMFFDEEVANQFAIHDPYVIHGLVVSWEIKPWNELVMDMINKETEKK